MSLAALAVRLATVRALRGRTAAGDHVTDSEIAPLDQRELAKRAPALVVYTDDSMLTPDGRSLIEGSGTLQLVVEIAVADQVQHEQTIDVTIPETDQGLELTLDLVDRQIRRCLSGDLTTWAALWRDLVLRTLKVESQRGAGVKDGVRFAARQLVLTIETLREPEFGRAPHGVWARFLEALEAEADLAPLAELMQAEIRGQALPDWRQIQALFALTEEAARGIGIATLYDDPIENPPLLERITIENAGVETVIEGDGPSGGPADDDGVLDFSDPSQSGLLPGI